VLAIACSAGLYCLCWPLLADLHYCVCWAIALQACIAAADSFIANAFKSVCHRRCRASGRARALRKDATLEGRVRLIYFGMPSAASTAPSDDAGRNTGASPRRREMDSGGNLVNRNLASEEQLDEAIIEVPVCTSRSVDDNIAINNGGDDGGDINHGVAASLFFTELQVMRSRDARQVAAHFPAVSEKDLPSNGEENSLYAAMVTLLCVGFDGNVEFGDVQLLARIAPPSSSSAGTLLPAKDPHPPPQPQLWRSPHPVGLLQRDDRSSRGHQVTIFCPAASPVLFNDAAKHPKIYHMRDIWQAEADLAPPQSVTLVTQVIR